MAWFWITIANFFDKTVCARICAWALHCRGHCKLSFNPKFVKIGQLEVELSLFKVCKIKLEWKKNYFSSTNKWLCLYMLHCSVIVLYQYYCSIRHVQLFCHMCNNVIGCSIFHQKCNYSIKCTSVQPDVQLFHLKTAVLMCWFDVQFFYQICIGSL